MRPINPDRLLEDVGLRLSELRKAQNLTQQALALKLNVSMRYVQVVEAGAENLTLRSLAAWASILHVPVTSMFEAPATRKRRPGY